MQEQMQVDYFMMLGVRAMTVEIFKLKGYRGLEKDAKTKAVEEDL